MRRLTLCATVALLAWGGVAQAQEAFRLTLANGMRVLVQPDPGTDIVAIDLLLDIAAADEPADCVGIRYLVQRMLLRGSTRESGDAMAERLASGGGMADIAVGLDYVELYLVATREGFASAMEMVADMVRRPAFLPTEVESQRQAAAELARASEEDPFQATYLALRGALYGDHPYSRGVFGDPESVAALDRDDLVAFHRRWYTPGRAVLAVAGGVEPAMALRAVERAFGDWTGKAQAREVAPEAPLKISRAVARERPGRRAHVLVGFPGPAAGEPGYCELHVLDTILSGGARGRLPHVLRDEMALAYTVTSFCPTLRGPGHLAVHVVTEPHLVEAVNHAVVGALEEVAARGVPPEELARAKRYLLGSYALGHQRQKERAYALAWYELLGLGEGFERRYQEAVEAVTAEGVQQAARGLLERYVVAVTMPER